MKILLCPEYFYPHIGGGEIWIWNVAKFLAKKGHKILVLTYKQPGHTKDESINGFKIKRLGSFAVNGVQPYFRRALIQGIGIIIQGLKQDYDIILASQTFPLIPTYIVSKMRRKPIIAVFHNIYGPSFSLKEKGLLKGLIRSLAEGIVLKLNYDAVLTVSKSTKRKLVHTGIDENKIKVVGVGVDLEKIDLAKTTKSDKPMIIYVGRLVKLKQVDHLIIAFKKVIEHVPDAELFIVGSGALKDELHKLVDRAGLSSKVHFNGFLFGKEKFRLIWESHLLVQPSAIEGLSIALVEAMACQTPIIAININGSKEVIVDGENGFLVPPNDVDQLASKIIEILKDRERAEAIGRKGRELVEEQYTWERVVEKVEKSFLMVSKIETSWLIKIR
ncbi:MAG: glycosyltransferase family 4 protein [Nitrososphaeria archaeon]